MSLDTLFSSILQSGMTPASVLVTTLLSLLMGVVIALIYQHRSTYSKSFVVTLSLLPAIVQVVIMLVNGNLGVGVAVMGAFSLVRFRSVAGSAREIGSIFFAMAIGLAMGTGYIAYAILFLLLIGGAMLLLNGTQFGEPSARAKSLRITIPENLEYDGLFDDLFAQYTSSAELVRVRTTNMGSLFELTYNIHLKDSAASKEFIDALRCRNGNLSIACGRPAESREVL